MRVQPIRVVLYDKIAQHFSRIHFAAFAATGGRDSLNLAAANRSRQRDLAAGLAPLVASPMKRGGHIYEGVCGNRNQFALLKKMLMS
jgi:hypothetical protein